MGIGTNLQRNIDKIVLRAEGDQVKVAYGNLQLCPVLEAGIEGVMHTVNHKREKRDTQRGTVGPVIGGKLTRE